MLTNYDFSLVLASYAVAVLAAYTALYFGARLSASKAGSRTVWLSVGALAMGTGVWTMHFVGMRASPVMAEMSYGAGLTAISWLAAVGASAVALHLIGRESLPIKLLIVASFAMGFGIVVMHYLGMYAMNMSLAPTFNLPFLITSIVIALAASAAALAICRRVGQEEEGLKAMALQLVSALVMAAAICGMHYTGMLAMMYPDAAVPAADNLMSGSWLGLPLALVCCALLAVAIVVVVMDMSDQRRVARQAEEQEEWVAAAAFTDSSTGLDNRSSMEKRILNKMAIPEADRKPFALIYLDIANYRDMSVNLKSKQLEEVVRTIASKIQECLGEGEDYFLARYSAGSFMVMVTDHESRRHEFAYKRLRALEHLTVKDGAPVLWRSGQAVYPDSGHSSRRLVRAALVTKPLSEVGSFENLADDPNLIHPGQNRIG